MNRVIKNPSFLLSIASVALLVGCGDQAINKSVVTNTGTGTGTGTGTSSSGNGGNGSSTTSNGGVECGSDDFCVNVVPPPATTMILHVDGDYSQPCLVQPGTDTACILEAQELDLYDQGVTFNYNVPPGMCSYFLMQPYFFYQYQPGVGPSQITITTDNTATPPTVSITSVSADAYPNTSGPDSQAVTVSLSSSMPVCSTDYTASGGPNCCFGNYTLTNISESSSGNSVSVAQVNWGGQPENCLVGPAMDSQTVYQGPIGDINNGYPRGTLTALDGSAVNSTYVVKSPLSKNFFSNAYIANYWQSGTIGSYPFSSAPNAVQGPAGFPTGNPWYEFDCLDPAEDLVARIRVMVRSWSSNAQFQEMIANQTGSPANGTYNLWGAAPSPFGDQPILNRETWVQPDSSTLGLGTAGTVSAPCAGESTTIGCGFGSMYPDLAL